MPAGDIRALKEYIDNKVDMNAIIDAVVAQISSSGVFITASEFSEFKDKTTYAEDQNATNFKSVLENQDGTSGLKTYYINIDVDADIDAVPYAMLKLEEDVQTDPKVYSLKLPLSYNSRSDNYNGDINAVANFHVGSSVNVYIAFPVFGPPGPTYVLLGTVTLNSYTSNFRHFTWHNSN